MSALDELLVKWRSNPDAGATLALCAYLSGSEREDLIREVGAASETWHAQEADVMLAVGRMYLDALMLSEAQAALVTAGKVGGSDARPFRYLGEVLLRRGDAIRAEKVFSRALTLGDQSPTTRMWHDRARVYIPLQARVGVEAVEAEVRRAIPKKTSIPPPPDRVPQAAPPSQPSRSRPVAVPPPPLLVPQVPAVMPDRDKISTLPQRDVPRTAAMPMRALGPTLIDGTQAPRTMPPVLAPAAAAVAAPGAALRAAFDNSALPSADMILQHLERVGIFEPGGGAAPAWEKAKAEKGRGGWVLVLALVLVAGAGTGGYFYAKKLEAERMAQARALEKETAALLDSGRLTDLKASDARLSRVFELDSRSTRAAELWLENRVFSALLLPDEPRGIESAIRRCQSLGVPEKDLAFARVASFVVEGDLAGAAALLPKWDAAAARDARYHLMAAALLERAGDLRAIGRYKQAIDADAGLLIARALHAEIVSLELGAEEAKPLIEAARERLRDRPEGKALGQLLWAVSDQRPDSLPSELALSEAERKNLPMPMAFIPLAVDGILAKDGASEALGRALAAASSPAQATFIGGLAVERADAELARKAGLKALGYSGMYPKARALASRVALLGSRLDDAMASIQELDPSAPEVAVVRAAAAYETLNLAELEGAVTAMGKRALEKPLGRALGRGLDVAMGQGAVDAQALASLNAPDVPWGSLIAADVALDQGNLETAGSIADGWGEQRALPVYAIRVARLERYRKNHDAAVAASETAIAGGSVTARVLVERYYDLVDAERLPDAKELLAKYPAVLGPVGAWLQAHADALGGKAARAKAFVAGLEAPPAEAPLLHRILAARTIALVKDRRAKEYVGDLLKAAKTHPDVVLAARAAGLAR